MLFSVFASFASSPSLVFSFPEPFGNEYLTTCFFPPKYVHVYVPRTRNCPYTSWDGYQWYIDMCRIVLHGPYSNLVSFSNTDLHGSFPLWSCDGIRLLCLYPQLFFVFMTCFFAFFCFSCHSRFGGVRATSIILQFGFVPCFLMIRFRLCDFCQDILYKWCCALLSVSDEFFWGTK